MRVRGFFGVWFLFRVCFMYPSVRIAYWHISLKLHVGGFYSGILCVALEIHNTFDSDKLNAVGLNYHHFHRCLNKSLKCFWAVSLESIQLDVKCRVEKSVRCI